MQRTRKDHVFVLLASGFEESDVTTVTRTLRRAGFPVMLVGLTAGPLRGAYGLSLALDRTLSEVETDHPQAIVLPGGVQGSRLLSADPRVHTLLRRVVDQGGYVAALDAACTVLRTAGVWTEVGEERFKGSASGRCDQSFSSEQVSMVGQVIVGCESAAAQELALTLAAVLQGREGKGIVKKRAAVKSAYPSEETQEIPPGKGGTSSSIFV
jgi:4-methyl-5(b-hydroxyethyl)-thiazole monophosphate biosynthesis